MKIKMIGGPKDGELVEVQVNENGKPLSHLNVYPDSKTHVIIKDNVAIDEVAKLAVYTLQIVCDSESERYEYHYQE